MVFAELTDIDGSVSVSVSSSAVVLTFLPLALVGVPIRMAELSESI
jgi:hypothetical protein